jgi:ureidoacrylate peracid hydrolase
VVTPDLAARLAPERSVLLLVDVQKDYCHPDGAFGRAGFSLGDIEAAVERMPALIEAARGAGVPVVFVRSEHDGWTDSTTWMRRDVRERGRLVICASGTWGAEFYRLQPAPRDCIVVKHRYSAFVDTRLPVVLRTLGRPTLAVAGITTNVCVESTVRDAFMRDYAVVAVEDCMAAPTREEHEAAIHNMRTYFGWVLPSAAVTGCWGTRP